MNKDQIKGRVREAAGKVQKKLGDALGSPVQEAKGMAREQAGKTQKNLGDAKEQVRKTREDTKPRTSTRRDKP